MKPTKRHTDPLGRSTTLSRYSRYAVCLGIAITGSTWPIQARSIEAIFDSAQLRVQNRVEARGTKPGCTRAFGASSLREDRGPQWTPCQTPVRLGRLPLPRRQRL